MPPAGPAAGFPLLRLLQKSLTFFEINFLLHHGDVPKAAPVLLFGMPKVSGLALFRCVGSALWPLPRLGAGGRNPCTMHTHEGYRAGAMRPSGTG